MHLFWFLVGLFMIMIVLLLYLFLELSFLQKIVFIYIFRRIYSHNSEVIHTLGVDVIPKRFFLQIGFVSIYWPAAIRNIKWKWNEATLE